MRATIPGTDAANAHVVHDSRTPEPCRTNSATSGLGAAAVRNIAETTRSPWYSVFIRYAPIRPAVGPGSDPKTRATFKVMGNRIPPARAVLDGVIGAIARSARTIE